MGEKRRFIRFDVIVDALCRTGGMLKKFKINNFSREGMGISSDQPLEEGQEIEVEMTIPGDNVPVLFSGKVAWVADLTSDSKHQKGGIKFKSIKNSDRGKILEYVYHKWVKARAKEKENTK